MASSNILDEELRREVARQRYGTALVNERIRPTSQELSRSLPRILSDYNWPDLSRNELNELIKRIRAEFKGTWSTMWQDITAELLELGEIEAAAVQGVYADFVPETLVVPKTEAIERAARTTVLTLTSTAGAEAGTWAQFMAANTDRTSQRIDGILRDAYGSQMTLQDLLTALRGRYDRRTKRYIGGLLNGRAVQGAEALARTGISHYANVARDEFATANRKVIQERILFATLDNSTTTICFKRHLSRYKIGEPYPPLPFHHNERSQYIFKTAGFDPLNTKRAATGGQSGEDAREKFEVKQGRTDKKVRYKGRADSEIFDVEMIDAKTTSDAWLRKQPRWFVESTLGKERAKLFLDGGLNIERFTDMLGRELTLNELRETSAGARAFRKANK